MKFFRRSDVNYYNQNTQVICCVTSCAWLRSFSLSLPLRLSPHDNQLLRLAGLVSQPFAFRLPCHCLGCRRIHNSGPECGLGGHTSLILLPLPPCFSDVFEFWSNKGVRLCQQRYSKWTRSYRLTLWFSLDSVLLHANMCIQMVQSSIGLLTSLPPTQIQSLDLIESSPRPLLDHRSAGRIVGTISSRVSSVARTGRAVSAKCVTGVTIRSSRSCFARHRKAG
jgi:hypothetical protein